MPKRKRKKRARRKTTKRSATQRINTRMNLQALNNKQSLTVSYLNPFTRSHYAQPTQALNRAFAAQFQHKIDRPNTSNIESIQKSIEQIKAQVTGLDERYEQREKLEPRPERNPEENIPKREGES
jgi:hypothetical protein